jgi:hypothetical protein
MMIIIRKNTNQNLLGYEALYSGTYLSIFRKYLLTPSSRYKVVVILTLYSVYSKHLAMWFTSDEIRRKIISICIKHLHLSCDRMWHEASVWLISSHASWNDKVICEQWIGRNLEGNDHVAIPESGWRDWEKSRKSSIRTAVIPAENQIDHLSSRIPSR